MVAVRNGATDEHSLFTSTADIEAVTFTQTGNMISGLATPDVLSIGYVDGGSRFTGLIDEVAIYDRVLPESEIQAHHSSGTRLLRWRRGARGHFRPLPGRHGGPVVVG